MIAGEGNLREEPTGVRSPVQADEGALVGASPRQAHDIDAAVHRPRTSAGGQADISDRTMRVTLFFGTEVTGSEPGASTRTRPALTWMRAPSRPT